MQLQILTFGIVKDIIGATILTLDVPNTMTVEALLDLLKNQYPALQNLTSLLVAVNNEYATKEHILKASDEVALIPPVSGG